MQPFVSAIESCGTQVSSPLHILKPSATLQKLSFGRLSQSPRPPLAASSQSSTVHGVSSSHSQDTASSTVQFGTVTASRNVQLQGGQGGQAAGAILGGLAGAALGQEVGAGTGQVIATGVGATAGAAAGLQAGKAAGTRQSIEWTVRLENGGSPTFEKIDIG